MPRFDWNPAKAKSNFAKHGVSFEDARGAFDDSKGLDFEDDPDEETGEPRYRLIGASSVGLLVVAYVERDAVRIMSARKAEKHEKKRYREG